MPNPNRNLLMTDGGGASFGTRLANAARPIGLAIRRATNQIIKNPVTPQRTSTGGGSTRASASVSASSAAPTGGAVYDANAAYNNLINQMRSKAEEAYRNNVATINNAYGQGVANVNSNYDNTRAQLGASYDKSQGDINRDSEGSLQQAYINKMLTQRGLQQELSAQGLNGGAAESTLASLANNYGNSRNNIETTKASNLADLRATYQKNLADALNARNNSLAQLEQRRASALQDAENQRANMYAGMISNGSISNLATADQSYLDALRQISEPDDGFRYAQLHRVRHVEGNEPDHGRERASLLKGAHAEAREAGNSEGEVVIAAGEKLGHIPLTREIVGLPYDALGVGRHETVRGFHIDGAVPPEREAETCDNKYV